MRLFCNVMQALLAVIVIIQLVLFLPLALLVLFDSNPNRTVFGYSLHIESSNNLSPTINSGDIVFAQQCNPDQLKENDVIVTIHSFESNTRLTYRFIRLTYNESKLWLITSNDGNNQTVEGIIEHAPISADLLVGKVVKIIPQIGLVQKHFGLFSLVGSVTGLLFLGICLWKRYNN